MRIQDQWQGSTEGKSHLFTDNVVQVRDTDISFDKRNLIHLFREGSLLDVVLDPHIVFRRRTALRNKHLLWKERSRQVQSRVVLSTKEMWKQKFYKRKALAYYVSVASLSFMISPSDWPELLWVDGRAAWSRHVCQPSLESKRSQMDWGLWGQRCSFIEK